jgi:hypothetical protein
MGCILILSTGVVMVLIAYCLHKQWKIAKVKRGGYRLLNADISILHSEEGTYGAKASDFELHRSRPDSESSAEEDDLDDINMDIYMDLVEAGDAFLSTYADVKRQRRKQQRRKRRSLLEILRELEKELSGLTEEARGHDMQVFDAELEDGVALADDEAAQERAEKARLAQEQRAEKERAAE